MRTLLFTLFLCAACKAQSPPTGCTTDADCKGSRICDAMTRLCVDAPDAAPPTDGASPIDAARARDASLADLSPCSSPAGSHHLYATNAILLPDAGDSFAIAIDGGGRPENQLRSIVSAITVAGFDLQGPVNAAVMAGQSIFLIDEQSADLLNGCAAVTVNRAVVPATPPTFAGNDNFQIDHTHTPSALTGQIGAGELGTVLPSQQTPVNVQTLVWNLPFGGATLPLTLYGAHLQGVITADGIMSGEIHGVLRQTDINNQIIPAIADLLTEEVDTNPMGPDTSTIINLFVTDPTALAACNADLAHCIITPAEVAGNSLIQNILAPDIEAFPAGMWMPVPNGPVKDSLSIGFGFTAVADTFH